MKVGGGIIPVMADVLFGLLGKGLRGRSWVALCICNVRFSGVSVEPSCVLLRLHIQMNCIYLTCSTAQYFIAFLLKLKKRYKKWLAILLPVELNSTLHTGNHLASAHSYCCVGHNFNGL